MQAWFKEWLTEFSREGSPRPSWEWRLKSCMRNEGEQPLQNRGGCIKSHLCCFPESQGQSFKGEVTPHFLGGLRGCLREEQRSEGLGVRRGVVPGRAIRLQPEGQSNTCTGSSGDQENRSPVGS